MNQEEAKKYASFMDKHKRSFGFSDYKIMVATRVPRREDPIAETMVNRLEKEMTVQLSSSFLRLPEERKRNVLIHELIHARVQLQIQHFEEQVEKIRYDFEEAMVNDFASGFMDKIENGEW